MCDDIEEFIAQMKEKGVSCTEVQREPWGLLTAVTLPGGGEIGIYQPLHPRPPAA